MKRINHILLACLALAVALLPAVPAGAGQRLSSEVLLPLFEVNLLKPSASYTLFVVGNALDKPVDIEIAIHTNWGLAVVKSPLRLAKGEIRTFDLRNWLVGDLPDRRLSKDEVDHVKAALTGQLSPKDRRYHGRQVGPGLAVGSVRIKSLGKPQPGALWGHYTLLNGEREQKSSAPSSAHGDNLINLDPGTECNGGCTRHAIYFQTTGTFDGDTRVVVWTDVVAGPSSTSQPTRYVEADTLAYDEAGQPLGGNRLRLLPVQVISIADLGLRQGAGWIDLRTEAASVVVAYYNSKDRMGTILRSYCLPDLPDPGDPGLRVKKRTNGEDADAAPGPAIKVGAPVLWEYVVENAGDVLLTGVEVSDDDPAVSVSCPKTALAAGERMTCTGRGTAEACQYKNIGTATAKTPDGNSVSAEDASHYFGDQNAALDLELLVNGQDADAPAGPTVAPGSRIDWTYIVTNKGDVALNEIKVGDDKGEAVSCPKTSLRPGESMTCTASGPAAKGQFGKVGSASGKSACSEVRDEDAAYYFGKDDDPPGISIKKLTNNDDCSAAPGKNIPLGSVVRWDYIVTNTGKVRLDDVRVTDDKEGAVSCPKTSLQPGESMTCAKTGVAKACQYSNAGTVSATSPGGKVTGASDLSWYFGQTSPAIQIKAYTNGQDADAAPGPDIPSGSPVQWTYNVTNTGNVALRDVRVTDDHPVVVSCPKTRLQPGESMTCSASGVAGNGKYSNVGTATGTADTLCGGNASASDPSHYNGKPPNLPPLCSGNPSLALLWPPNHKMVDIQVLGIVEPNGDPVTIQITGITQDEPVNEKGDGNTGPDGAGVGTATAQVRAERSGLGDGRVYVIHYSAKDNQGGTCTGTVSVGVPHDQSGAPPVDSGQLYDSTVSK